MIYISPDEVLKLAKLSRISIHPDEVENICVRLQQVLEYAACVSTVAGDQQQNVCNVNVFRDDVVAKTDSAAIINQAPDHQDNLFVVPSIIKNS